MRASFDNPDHLLLPGMAVVCRISGGISQNVMTLPAKAVMRDPKGRAYVFTVQGDRVVQTEVRLGELYNDGWQILEGLDSSFEVVIAGNAVLHHGSKVQVINRDGIDLKHQDLSEVAQDQQKNTAAAVQAVVNPTVSASGLDQSSVTAPNTP